MTKPRIIWKNDFPYIIRSIDYDLNEQASVWCWAYWNAHGRYSGSVVLR